MKQLSEKTIQKITLAIICSAALLVTTACSSQSSSDRKKRPNYVTMNTELMSHSNSIMWEVDCGDFEVAIADDKFDDFYKDDGELKTKREYCDYSRDRMRRRK